MRTSCAVAGRRTFARPGASQAWVDTIPPMAHRVQVIDSHTGGEPTRIVIAGGPEPLPMSMTAARAWLRDRHDWLRRTVVLEPRGSDVLVGGWLCAPSEPSCAAGIVFFNNAGYLGMCGHGTIGLLVTLAHLGRISPGTHRIDTPVGVVEATLRDAHTVTIRNVPAYRVRKGVAIDVPGLGTVTGDVAWGGNWFFLCDDHGQEVASGNLEDLTDVAWRIRSALVRDRVTGDDGAEVDHIELFAPSMTADSRSFVLCPGKAYDRSPCGTGTSAKLACLIADGKLAPGEIWRQESVIGSMFKASAEVVDGRVIPTITGSAYITGEATLLLDDEDPYRLGIG